MIVLKCSPKLAKKGSSFVNFTSIHTYLIDRSPWGLFRANESMKQQNITTSRNLEIFTRINDTRPVESQRT